MCALATLTVYRCVPPASYPCPKKKRGSFRRIQRWQSGSRPGLLLLKFVACLAVLGMAWAAFPPRHPEQETQLASRVTQCASRATQCGAACPVPPSSSRTGDAAVCEGSGLDPRTPGAWAGRGWEGLRGPGGPPGELRPTFHFLHVPQPRPMASRHALRTTEQRALSLPS